MINTEKAKGTIVSLLSYGKIARDLKKVNSNIFFVFPTYQIGGAERVHAEIMAVVADQNPTCIITEEPKDEGFKQDFYRAAKIIELKRWGTKKAFVPIMAKKIAETINRQDKPIVFGCNAEFMYKITDYLDKRVEVIDLTHAFTPNLMGMEFYSLPYVKRIDRRITIGRKTQEDYRDLYQKNDISLDYMDRFKTIPNQVDAPNDYVKEEIKLPLKVIFVSRNSPEKRPGVFLKIAKKSYERGLPLDFIMVGDFEEHRAEYGDYINFTGPVTNKTELDALYRSSDIILITSVLEGFPMVLLEGMAVGVVPISTEVGDIPSLIGEKLETGFLVGNLDDEEKLADAFIKVLMGCTENLDALGTFSKTAYSLVKKEFSSEKFTENYRLLFQSFCKDHGSR